MNVISFRILQMKKSSVLLGKEKMEWLNCLSSLWNHKISECKNYKPMPYRCKNTENISPLELELF